MISVDCSCGGTVEVPFDSIGQRISCPKCQRALRVIAADAPGASEHATGRLIVAEGPENVGEQLALFGNAPLVIGNSAENAIVLHGEHISRTHATLTRTSDGWHIDADRNSELLVNGERTESHDLQTGDLLQIGDYELEYAATEPSASPIQSHSIPTQRFTDPAPTQIAGGVVCPSCKRSLPFGSKICVDCGIDLRTGRTILTSREVDENALYVHTETVVRGISWLIPLGVYPVASEGFGSRKPWVIWIIAALTIAIGVTFWIKNLRAPESEPADLSLRLWVGNQPPPATRPQTLDELLAPTAQVIGDFHPWQLLTYAFLHASILHLAGNMVFLIVLGSRVNALIGQIRTAIVYPLLAIAAGIIDRMAEAHGTIHAVVGASGAIMGLAGMYLVLFPIHRVHVVAWARMGFAAGFWLALNIFAVRGVSVVLFYIAFDVIATLLGTRDGVAHWAHLGGFGVGIVVALLLLLARQVNARGGDILSVSLGRYAWFLLGKPAGRA